MLYKIHFSEDLNLSHALPFSLQENEDYCLALKAKEIIGYATYTIQTTTLHITKLHVDKHYISRGIIGGLILKLENKAFSCQLNMLIINNNEAEKHKQYFLTRGFISNSNHLIKNLANNL